jgi:hypothetical protein
VYLLRKTVDSRHVAVVFHKHASESRSPYAGGPFAAASRFFAASMAFAFAAKLSSLRFPLPG